jgi:hypothetical protein
MDCEPVSHWQKNKLKDREGLRLASDFKESNLLLDKIQDNSGRLIYLEGNHEFWLRDAINAQPELEGLINLEPNLRFDERKVEFHEYNKVYRLGKLAFTHGLYTSQNHAKRHVDNFGCSIVYGHMHDVQLHVKVSPIDVEDKHLGLSLGCLANTNPTWLRNRPNNWVHCLGLGTVRASGNFSIDPVIICNGEATYAGKTFRG